MREGENAEEEGKGKGGRTELKRRRRRKGRRGKTGKRGGGGGRTDIETKSIEEHGEGEEANKDPA